MERTNKVEVGGGVLAVGWLFSVAAALVPLLGLAGVITGIIVATKGRMGHGVGMISVSVWLAVAGMYAYVNAVSP